MRPARAAEQPRNGQQRAAILFDFGGTLDGTKTPVPDGEIADVAVVVARTGNSGRESDVGLFIVDLKAKGVERTAMQNLDPTRSR